MPGQGVEKCPTLAVTLCPLKRPDNDMLAGQIAGLPSI